MPAPRPPSAERESLASLLHRVQLLAGDLLLLVMLDVRHSAHRAMEIVFVVVVCSVLIVSAWLALVVAASGWLLGSGASWTTVLLVAAALNVVVALLAVGWVRRRQAPLFAATLRQLRAEPPEEER